MNSWPRDGEGYCQRQEQTELALSELRATAAAVNTCLFFDPEIGPEPAT